MFKILKFKKVCIFALSITNNAEQHADTMSEKMKNLDKLHEQLKQGSTTICAFHIGRGGRFNNHGFVRFLAFKPIGHYVDDLFLKFENESHFKNRYGFDSTGDKSQRCILDLITDRDFEELEEKFGITESELGEEIYTDGSGNPVGLTKEEKESGIGRIDIDGEYDTTYTRFLTDCSEGELQLIKDSFLVDSLSYDEQRYVNLSLGIEE